MLIRIIKAVDLRDRSTVPMDLGDGQTGKNAKKPKVVAPPVLHSPRHVKTLPGVRSQFNSSRFVDRHVYAYSDHAGNEFRKSFETEHGKAPYIPSAGTHGEIGKHECQHIKRAALPTLYIRIVKRIL